MGEGVAGGAKVSSQVIQVLFLAEWQACASLRGERAGLAAMERPGAGAWRWVVLARRRRLMMALPRGHGPCQSQR